MNKNKKIIASVVGVIVLAGAFYGGMIYQKNKTAKAATTAGQGRVGAGAAAFRNRGGAAGAGFVGGMIISKDSNSITVQLPNNSGTKIVFLSGSSQILKSVSGSVSDLAVGQQVTVMGSANSDGSVTAQGIQIRPAGSPGFGGGFGGGANGGQGGAGAAPNGGTSGAASGSGQ